MQAVRPPAVADGTSRLRLTAMATHTRAELREAARVLARAALQAVPASSAPRRRRGRTFDGAAEDSRRRHEPSTASRSSASTSSRRCPPTSRSTRPTRSSRATWRSATTAWRSGCGGAATARCSPSSPAPATCASRRRWRSRSGASTTLWPLTEGRRVVKTRHLVPLRARGPGRRARRLRRRPSTGCSPPRSSSPPSRPSEAFVPPPWLGRDITGDARYANQSLALHGRPEP